MLKSKRLTKALMMAFGLFCFATGPLFAQNGTMTITGTVKDASSGEAVIGAAVQVKNTTKGAITDLDGNFEIVAGASDILVFSSIGYETIEENVDKRAIINVKLNVESTALEETVFVGYGTMRKKDLTGAITQVKSETVEKEAPRSLQDILRGSVAGITMGMATDVSGDATIQIRGKNTLSSGSEPLIVLDGVIYNGNLNEINPNDIETIDVLKDASSVAIYGAKASNGVVAVTTKRGKSDSEGTPLISFNTTLGLARAANLTPVLGGTGFVQFRQDYFKSLLTEGEIAAKPGIYDDPRTLKDVNLLDWYNYTQSSQATVLPGEDELVSTWLARLNLSPVEIENYLKGNEVNWDKYYFPTALQQDYTVSISNKTSGSSYYASVSYSDRDSYIAHGNYKNISGRVNLESDVTKWLTIGVNAQFSARNNDAIQAGTGARTQLSPYTENLIDDMTNYYARYPNGDALIANPFWDRLFQDKYARTSNLTLNTFALIKLPFGIEFQTNYSPRLSWGHTFTHNSSENPNWGTEQANSSRAHDTAVSWQLDNVLRWKKQMGYHRVEATLGYNVEQNQSWSTTATNKFYSPSDVLSFHNLGAGTSPTVSSSDNYSTGDGLMARLFYSFNSRYMLTASVRRDGYSAFGVNNPRGTFPSLALGWVFSQEKWMRGANSWLNYGKLRLSYGINGNRSIGTYAALARLTSGLYEYIDSSNGSIYQVSQIYVSQLGNSNLRWERTSAFDVGLDFTLFNKFIDGNVDWYQNNTTDLIVTRALPNITGFSSITTNLGELQNRGFELQANIHPINNPNLRWDSSLTFYFNRRKVLHLYGDMEDILDDNGNVIGQKESDDYDNGWFIGHDPDEIYDYVADGVWQLGEEDEAARYGLKPGDFKYSDLNDDGTYNEDDKMHQGIFKTPRYQFSMRNDFTVFKNFSIGFMAYAKIGQWGEFNNAANTVSNADRYSNYDLPRWTESNPTNEYGRIGSVNKGTHYVRKNFFRMESINVSYIIPKAFLDKVRIDSGRLTLSVRNPFFYSPDWNFGDPEGGQYTPQSVNLGISISM